MGVCGLFAAPVVIAKLVSGDEYSYSTRLDAWRIMLQIIQVNPVLGLGPSNYYSYSALFAIRGYSVSFNSHNQYIDLLAQTGIIGFSCYLWFFGEVAWMGWHLRQRVPAGFAHAYVYGALGGLCGMLVAGTLGDWVLPFVYNVGLVGMRSSLLGWLFLGGLVTLERQRSTRRSHPPTRKLALPTSGQQIWDSDMPLSQTIDRYFTCRVADRYSAASPRAMTSISARPAAGAP
jgi:hypothetical protein